MKAYDAIVIGGGLGGLSIAALLSNGGYDVLCLEKSKKVGGRAMIMKKDGFTYDYGMHVVRYGHKGACGEILKKIGVKDFNVKKLDVALYYHNKFHNFSSGGLSSLLRMGLLNKKDKTRFLKEIIKLGYGDIDSLYTISVLELCKRRNYSENLKKIFASLSTSMLSCPDTSKASAGELAHHLKNVVKKRYAAGYPIGSFETIINHLTDKINEKNEIRLNTKVKELIKSNYRVIGVNTGKEKFYAEYIICAVPPPALCKLTDVNYVPEPTSGVSIDYALNTEEYKENRVILTPKPRGVALFTSNVDKSVAPKGKSLFTFFSPVNTKNRFLLIKRKRDMEALIEEMFPGISSKIENKRIMYLKVVDGVELNTEQYYHKRLENRIGRGLYVVGDTTKAHGNGAEIAFNSALECYKEIKND